LHEHTFVPKKPSFSEEQVRGAIAVSESYSAALRWLGMRPAGGNHKTLRRYVEMWGIPTDHFDPAAARLCALARHRYAATPLEEVLVRDSTYSRGTLKQRLYAEGLKGRRCELCGQDEVWRERRMALILDHINGVADDNRLENLQIVCPNCAATLDTHCGRQNRRPEVRRTCPHCGKEFVATDPRRRYCSRYCGRRWDRHAVPRPGARRVERPPYEALLEEIAATNWSAVGRRYGVSDNAVRKWVRAYEAERRGAASGG
jgi:hypothetical protein